MKENNKIITNETLVDEAQDTYKKLNTEFEELGCFTNEKEDENKR